MRKATAKQKEVAKKLGIRTTKTVRGKRVPLSSTEIKAKIAKEKEKRSKRKARAKKRVKSTRQTTTGLGGTYNKSADRSVKASTVAGRRKSKKTSIITYKVKDPKTGKMVWKRVRRANANQHVKAGKAGGKTYTERRKNRSDSGTFL